MFVHKFHFMVLNISMKIPFTVEVTQLIIKYAFWYAFIAYYLFLYKNSANGYIIPDTWHSVLQVYQFMPYVGLIILTCLGLFTMPWSLLYP